MSKSQTSRKNRSGTCSRMPAPSPESGSAPEAPRWSRLRSAVSACCTISWLGTPVIMATNATPQASCSCWPSYSPWGGGIARMGHLTRRLEVSRQNRPGTTLALNYRLPSVQDAYPGRQGQTPAALSGCSAQAGPYQTPEQVRHGRRGPAQQHLPQTGPPPRPYRYPSDDCPTDEKRCERHHDSPPQAVQAEEVRRQRYGRAEGERQERRERGHPRRGHAGRVDPELLHRVHGHRVVEVAMHLLRHGGGGVRVDALLHVERRELGGLALGVGQDLGALLVDLRLHDLALAGDAVVLTDRHRQRSARQPPDAGEHDRRVGTP